MAKTARSFILPGLILLLSLLLIPVRPAIALPGDTIRWSPVNLPADGRAGNWVLADGSDIQHLAMAIDGTLYAYGSGLTYTLLKSTDGGYSWSYTGMVRDSIVDIAIAPDDASVVYYATSSNVYKSADAGNSFVLMSPNPGGAGTNNVEITTIDVTYPGDYLVAVGTRDTDGSEYGGVYVLDESEFFAGWTDTNAGSYDVYAVAFSPNFPASRQLVVVVTDETDTIVTTTIGGNGWGLTLGTARLDRDNSGIPTPVAVAVSADIAFPEDYGVTMQHNVLLVAIDTGTGNGDVYRISRTTATDLNIGFGYGLSNVDVTALAVAGNAATANLLAGAAGSALIYVSVDGGINWTMSTKEPTGQAKTCVVMAADFSGSGKAYAATTGTESAFSYTADGGVTWNQSGLIDTKISDILELAPSPNYSRDNTLFMLTWGGKHSLWRSLNGGDRWERVYSSALASVDSIKRVELSPRYGDGTEVVFITGNSGGNTAIWNSADNGQNFGAARVTRDPVTGATFSISTWTVVDDNTLFLGSYDGSNGLVYHTTNSGWWFSAGAVAGTQSLHSIALSPNYDQDGTIVVGNTNGWVYWSNDKGTTFEPLPSPVTSPPLTGRISVTFDSHFSSNHTVYAASDTQDKGIYRFTVNRSTEWKSIDSTLPGGGTIGQLRLLADGTLYAINPQPVDAANKEGGMERCLNPTNPLSPVFETVTRGLDDGATLSGLWLCEHRLWSIDTTNTRLMTYIDSLTLPVNLVSPSDGVSGVDTGNLILDWEILKGTTRYQWQLDCDTDFANPYGGFEGNTEVVSARLPAFGLATTYYWRVRATEPVLSPWSAKWSFTTSLGGTTAASKLVIPEAGASDVGLKPIFQWGAVAGADSYELLVSKGISFTVPIITKVGAYALATTAWRCDITLDYDTTYYWKVRAIGSGTSSDWSAISAFATESPPDPIEPSPAPESSSPAPEFSSPAPEFSSPALDFSLPAPDFSSPAPTLLSPVPEPPVSAPGPRSSPVPSPPGTPDWVIYLMGLMGFVIIMLLITTLVLVVRPR